MKIIFGRLLCKLFSHKRGRRVQGTPVVECPRCKARWQRPVAKAAK